MVTRDLVDAVCAAAEKLCSRLAPIDLAGLPVYVIPGSRLPADLGGEAKVGGYTYPTLDLHLRPFIPHWRGRGPALVVNDREPWFFPENLGAEDFRHMALNITLHELAHILQRPAPFYADHPDCDPEVLRSEAQTFAAIVSSPATPEELAEAPLRHGSLFIRIALHLVQRAKALGVPTGAGGPWIGTDYFGLSPAWRYSQTLADEFGWLANASFFVIKNLPPPAAFLSTWQEDLAALGISLA